MIKVQYVLAFIVVLCLSFMVYSLESIKISPSINHLAPTITDKPSDVTTDKIWSLVQDWRMENNLQTYIKDEKYLCPLAETRLKEIQTDFSHSGFEKRKGTLLPSYLSYEAGENLAKDFTYADNLVNGWLNSPSHLENLKKNYKYSCIATDGNYAVQMFASFQEVEPIAILPTDDPNPFVNCKYEHIGTRQMRKSDCESFIECEIDGSYVLTTSASECNNQQKKYWEGK